MFGRFILSFLMLAFIDFMLLIQIGQWLGFWATLGLVVLTAMLGTALARRQGLQTFARINTEVAAGRAPTTALADGAGTLLAAALFITPGFITDLLGLSLLVPPVRRWFRNRLLRRFERQVIATGFSGPTEWTQGNNTGGDPCVDDFSGPRPVKHVENEALRK